MITPIGSGGEMEGSQPRERIDSLSGLQQVDFLPRIGDLHLDLPKVRWGDLYMLPTHQYVFQFPGPRVS